jgi:hypothetical protein
MIYMGLGNSGSKILWNFHEFLFQPNAMPEALPRLANTRFLIGDADTNNSVIHEVSARKLHQTHPPQAINLMDLARYWSGGCGVYHIIGELLAETAMKDPEFSATLSMYGRQPVTLLLSAGGGTGGGISGAFRQQPPDGVATLPNVRLFTVLPEVDQFQDGGLEITGPDGFQCASAGRFLLKFVSDAARLEAGQLPQSATADLFLLSNSYLSCIPASVSYEEGVRRLNRLLAHALVMMPTDVNQSQFPARRRLVTFGLGAAPRLQPGHAEPQTPSEVARDLVRSALTPVDLARTSPTGLSALPVECNKYRSALADLLDPEEETSSELGQGLQRVFQRCIGVDAWLWYRGDADNPTVTHAMRQEVDRELVRLFGDSVRVKVWDGGVLPHAYMPDLEQPGQKADYALLILLSNFMVEDVFRLVMYFIESSFGWLEGSVANVADRIHRLLTDRNSTAESIEEALVNPPGSPAEEAGAVNKVRLDKKATETYPQHFWGNIDDLRSKVLQSLNRKEEDFEKRLLRVQDIAYALKFFHSQIWRYH